MENLEDKTVYKVVVNHEGQYSIWPVHRDNPPGWREVNQKGLKKECLAFIKAAWVDKNPVTFKVRKESVPNAAAENGTACSSSQCIHELFEMQVESRSDCPAVIFGDEQLSYAELNCRANQLAHFIQEMGLESETRVALCLERSLDMVVGMLAIIKAGAVYLPMDPSYPEDRLALLLQEAQVRVLVTQERLLRKFSKHEALVICLDQEASRLASQNAANCDNTTSAENLAYMIYTSGSTGKPKGVMVKHESLWHYAQDLRTQLGIMPDDVYLHTASIAFSSSVRQLVVPLTSGAAVTITTSEQKTNPLELFDLIKRRNVTIMDTVPTFWRSCLHALTTLEPQSRKNLLDNKLRLILTTGEPLSYQVVDKWRYDFDHPARLVNMYGATETSGSVAIYPIRSADAEQANIVPLGKPIANVQAYVIGSDLEPVPYGSSGELCIAGPRIAQGYLNRPELTAVMFIPDAFSRKPGARMWRTGDLARYLPDGNIGFVGRIDFQINVSGIRIEPGEIESVLADHPAVQHAVVAAREDDHGEKQLVAYLTCNPENIPTVSHLRNFLQSKIPEHMIPAAFVVLNSMPLTSSGKIDRKILPAPRTNRPNLGNPFVQARTPIEETLLGIWSKVLGIDEVGIQDNFFELGGNSLKGTRVVSHIRDALFLDLPVRLVFENPTIAELALAVVQRKAEQAEHADIEQMLLELEMLTDKEAQELFYRKNY
jgi:amino acid adenylation domain-containing protein